MRYKPIKFSSLDAEAIRRDHTQKWQFGSQLGPDTLRLELNECDLLSYLEFSLDGMDNSDSWR